MAGEGVPVDVTDVMDVARIAGVAPAALKMQDVTMDAGRSVVVRCNKGAGGTPALNVISLEDPEKVRLTLPMKADAAVMAPTAPLLAVRSDGAEGCVIQVYDLLSREKIADVTHPERVDFWKWTADDRVVLVGGGAVHHLSLRPTPTVTRTHALRGELTAAGVFVWNYVEDADGVFRFVLALTKGTAGGVQGLIQYEPVGAPHHARVLHDGFVVACSSSGGGGGKVMAYAKAGKLTLVKMDGGGGAAAAPQGQQEAPLAFEGKDFPVAVLFHPPAGPPAAVAVVSKEGCVQAYEVAATGLRPLAQFALFQQRGLEAVTRAATARGGGGAGFAFYVLSTQGKVRKATLRVDAPGAGAAAARRQQERWATFTGLGEAPPPAPAPAPAAPAAPAQRYEVLRRLGVGGQGSVVLARLKLARGGVRVGGEPIVTALKQIPCRSLDEANYALEEVKALQANAGHAGVVQIYDFFLEQPAAADAPRAAMFNVCIACEYCPRGDLGTYLRDHGAPPPKLLRRWAGEVTAALAHLHAAGFIHRDLKPANILLTDDDPPVVKLADFGLARGADANAVTCCGTPMFIAPEILAQQPTTCAVDMWSLGCVLYYVATQKDRALNYQIQGNVNLRTEIRHDLAACGAPPFFADAVASLVQLAPAARPTAQQMVDRLRAGGQ